VNNELKSIWWKEAVMAYYLGMFLEELKKTTKILSQNNSSLRQDMNPGPLIYKAEVLPT
jgi:hypothetical protein